MLNVRWRQSNLKYYMLYYKGNIDGIEGTLTKSAYRMFQKNHNLVVDGIYGKNTNAKLILVVKDIQNKLNEKVGSKLVLDGKIGTNTINAIKLFQKRHNLVVDGIVGVNTLPKLNETENEYMTENDWKNSKYFKKEEFRCTCNGRYCNGYPSELKRVLVENMNLIRARFGRPIQITSGLRCQQYNDTLYGSTKNSKHITGRACDFWFTGANKNTVIKYIKTLPRYNYTYSNNTNMKYAIHIDIK